MHKIAELILGKNKYTILTDNDEDNDKKNDLEGLE